MIDLAPRATCTAAATPQVADARLRLAQSLGRLADTRDPAVRRHAASRLTSELFFKPMLAEMRKFPFGRELITDGWAGSAFDQTLDERMADAVSSASRALTDRIAADLSPAAASARPEPAPAPGSDQARWPLIRMLATNTESQP
jgi:Rod binding domain-containing protein